MLLIRALLLSGLCSCVSYAFIPSFPAAVARPGPIWSLGEDTQEERRSFSSQEEPAPAQSEEAKIVEIVSIEDFNSAVAASEEDLVLIKAYVPWCRACKAFDQKFRKYSLELEEREKRARFYSLDLYAVKDVKKILEIRVAPTIVIYQDGKKKEQFHCGPSKFAEVVKTTEPYLQERPDL